jgi:23S rRNA (cytosine1962-C5)-methyltransferase
VARQDGHELLDAGEGRRLDRFGEVVVDRPAPGVEDPPCAALEVWASAVARFDRDRGWQWRTGPPDAWTVTLDELVFELRPAAGGQVGMFPEHATHWPWLRERAAGRAILNLFAYTGAATLAVARSGAAVTHVDAARTAVAWARRNAARNGLSEAPVRWIVDDAAAFLAREVRRGRRYAGIILDPPSYGHGPRGSAWRLEDDLPSLLDACRGVLEPAGFVLLTAHTPAFGPARLGELLEGAFGPGAEFDAVTLEASSGASLAAGAYARWTGR